MKPKVIKFTQYHKNTLQGFVTVYLPETGMVIPSFSLHQNDRSRWLEIPAKPPTNPESNSNWQKIIYFLDDRDEEIFMNQVMQALDEYLGKRPDISFD
ncbi:MAG: hypothetical protein FJ134_06350 [Deltaproteobacteria bacterium]|nr:hypothetical protein [Deltaproteobacteria bacterium]